MALDIATRQLDQQRAELRHLRSQASFLAAFTGLLSGLFARLCEDECFRSSTDQLSILSLSIEAIIVLVLFAASLVCSALILTTRKPVTFDLSPRWITERNSACGSFPSVTLELAHAAEDYFDENEKVLTEAQNLLWWGVVMGWCQIPAWLLLIL